MFNLKLLSNKLVYFFLYLVIFSACCYGQSDSDNISLLPVKTFPAKIFDIEKNIIQSKHIRINGKIYLQVYHEKEEILVPFNKIDKISVKEQARFFDINYYYAILSLKNGQAFKVLIANDAKIQGEANSKKFEYFIKDIKSINFP